jgi:hypothetical protein
VPYCWQGKRAYKPLLWRKIMTRMESAVRELIDALVILRPKLMEVDEDASIDENVERTGVEERFVKAYLMGVQAIN